MAAGTPQGYETAIWYIAADAGGTDTLYPSWVNPDGSTPAVTVAYFPAEDAFVLTGNLARLRITYGGVPYSTVRLLPSSRSLPVHVVFSLSLGCSSPSAAFACVLPSSFRFASAHASALACRDL